MGKHLRIGLVFDTRGSYARDEVRGVIAYARSRRLGWLFAGGDDTPATWAMLAEWRPDGIIGALLSPPGPLAVPAVTPLLPQANGAVRLDNEGIGRLAAEHLLERGFRHLAFLSERGEDWARERGAGFAAAWQGAAAAGRGGSCQQLELPAHGRTDWRPEGGDLAAWLQALPKPAGVFACRDLRGRELAQTCLHLGLDVPGQVAIVGVDNDDLLCELSTPPLSSVEVPWERIGFHMGERLDCLLAGTPPPPPALLRPRGVRQRRSSEHYAVADLALRRTCEFLREHLAEPLQVSDLARAAGLSRRGLERRYRRDLGCTPHAHLHRLRLELACRLLRDTGLPLARIAEQSGFDTPPRLAKVIRAALGCTPSSYRAQFAPR